MVINMNFLLLRLSWSRLIIGIVFLCISFNAALASASADEKRSGVVKPKISTLKTKTSLESPVIEEYIFPAKYSIPFGLAIDSKGMIWVTEMAGNSLAVLDPATNILKEYRIPSTVGIEESEWKYDPSDRTTPEKFTNVYSVGNPGNVIVDKNDLIWFVLQQGNAIVRFDPSKEEFTEFTIPTANSQPYDLAVDSKGRIWFIEKNTGKLGYLDVAQEKSYEIDIGAGSNLMGIAVARDDTVWIGDVAGNYIGRYDPKTKKFKVFPINVPSSQPGLMRFDDKGILWICNLHARQLGVLMTEAGVYSVVDLPGYNTVPQALAIASDGKVWIVDSMTNLIGYFDSVNMNWRMFSLPTSNAQPMNVAIDSTGDVWFTQSDRNANSIARLKISTIPADKAGSQSGGSVEAKQGKDRSVESKDQTNTYISIALVLAALVIGFAVIRRFR